MSCTVVDVYKISDENAASVNRTVNWSHDIRSQKTDILWSLSEEPQTSLVSF